MNEKFLVSVIESASKGGLGDLCVGQSLSNVKARKNWKFTLTERRLLKIENVSKYFRYYDFHPYFELKFVGDVDLQTLQSIRVYLPSEADIKRYEDLEKNDFNEDSFDDVEWIPSLSGLSLDLNYEEFLEKLNKCKCTYYKSDRVDGVFDDFFIRVGDFLFLQFELIEEESVFVLESCWIISQEHFEQGFPFSSVAKEEIDNLIETIRLHCVG